MKRTNLIYSSHFGKQGLNLGLTVLILCFGAVGQLLAQPVIHSFSPESGQVGTEVTISGSNFSTSSPNTIYFGGVQAEVVSSTGIEIIATVPAGASYHPISIHTDGQFAVSNNAFRVTFDSDSSINVAPGTFKDYESWTPGRNPRYISNADLDGDGLLDIVVSSQSTDKKLSVLHNTSTGMGDLNFAVEDLDLVSFQPDHVITADFDGDGKLDIATANSNGSATDRNLTVFNNNSTPGDISMTNDFNVLLNSSTPAIAANDLNADGKIDLVALDSVNNQFVYLENTTTSGLSFATEVGICTGDRPVAVASTDFNQDGLPDVITLNRGDTTVSVFENTSSAGVISFGASQDFPLEAEKFTGWMVVGDVNNDGAPDVIATRTSSITILKNESSTTSIDFDTPLQINLANVTNFNVFLDDINGDGWADVIFPSFAGMIILENKSTEAILDFGNEIIFDEGISLTDHTIRMASSGDFDGDGEPDIVFSAGQRVGFSYNYHVDIFRNKHSNADITSFSFAEQLGAAVIDEEANTIAIEVVDVVDLTNLIPTFDVSVFASIEIEGVAQVSGVTANDYTNPITYSVNAEDGTSVEEWIVTVTLGCPADEVTEVVEACGIYEFDGQLLGNTGIYTGLFMNAAGCDSTVTLDLTIHPTTFYENVYATGSYDFDGATLNVSGQYEYGPFTSATGCDSTYVLNLTIEPDTYDAQDILRFEPQPVSMINVPGSNHVGDLDGDSDLDVLVIGALSILNYDVAIYLNNGDGTFTEKENTGIANNISARPNASRLVDMDGDDDLDFLMVGFNEATNAVVRLFLNDGMGNFTKKTGLGLPTLEDAALDHADVDGDGDQDVIMLGAQGANVKTLLFLNDGNATFTQVTGTDFIGGDDGSVDFGDLDGDGDQDLFITGNAQEFTGVANVTEIYLNDGLGNFQCKINQPFFQIDGPAVEIIDLDGDGDLDIFASGDGPDALNNVNASIYRNDGNANFTRDISSDIPEIVYGDVAFADFDNDGDPDMLISGELDDEVTYDFDATTRIYLNSGFGHFTQLEVCNFISMSETSVSIGDLDGDGIQDFVMNGRPFVDGFSRNDTTVVYFGAQISNDLTIEAVGSYDFDGETLTASGTYQGISTDESECEYPVNLDLTIIPFVSESEYANVSFELVQPVGSPKIGLDLPKGIRGNNHIYDMDGDGDQDVLYFAVSPGGTYKLLAYLNDGAGNYRRVDQQHNFEFSTVVNFPIVRTGDLNNDGIEDLIIGGEPAGASAVVDLGTKVYFGSSEGQLHYQSDIQLSTSQIGDVQIQDFNVDGFPDIFIIHRSDAFLYLNDGMGNFAEAPTTGMNNGVGLLRLAVSAPYDGGVDIMVTDFNMGLVHIIYRYEAGAFTEVSRGFTELDNFFHRFDFADANADGYPDLFILFHEEPLLYLNDQSGNYLLDTSNDFDGIETVYTHTLHFEDLNNDNAAEVLFAGNANDLAVFWNDGIGGYASHQTYELNDNIAELTIGDLNGDGFSDILNNGQAQGSPTADEWITRIYLNTQADAFEAAALNVTTEVRDGDLAFFDANGDGHQDLIISGGYYESTRSTTELYTNDGTGIFTEVLIHPFEGLDHASIAVADLNGDDHEDVLLSGQNLSSDISTKLYWNDGVGNFTADATSNLMEVLGEVVILDANGDDVPDLLVAGEDDTGTGITELYLGDGMGSFTGHTSGIAGWLDPEIAVGDVDDDDDIDILVVGTDATEGESAQLYLNDGAGNFTDDPMFTASAFNTGAVVLADLDSDDDLDIYLSGNGQFAIYENDGSGTFTSKHNWEGPYRSAATIGDIDNDGDADIIESGNWESTTGEPRTFVYFNDGNANFTKASIGALHGNFDGALTLGDIDGDMDLDLMLSGAVIDPVTSSSRLYRNNSPLVTRVTQNVEVCDSYTFFGQVLSESGRYENTTTNADNSRTITTLNLTITEVSVEELEVAVCERYEWHEEIYTESGEYEVETTGDDSCPVLQKLSLTILEPTFSEEEVAVCEMYEWNGKTYTASGTYQELLTNAAGCDSTATLQLAILEPTDGFMEVGACGNYVWEGEEYTESGTYQKTLINAAGCDSLATLDLTILFSSLSLEIAQACDSYEWGGTTYTESGSYEVLLTNKAGCDSTATLNLTLQESSTGEASVESCGSYDWEGVTYDASGSYETILTNSVGCDSITTLNLTVLPAPAAELEEDGDGLALTDINVGDTYQWYDCIRDLPIAGATESTFEPTVDGEYYIEVNNGLCTVTSLCAEATMVVTSVEDTNSPLVRLYPNPTSAHLNIELGQFYDELQVEVMDLTGRRLEDIRPTLTDQLTLNVSRWSGVIMIRISTSEEVILQSRVLVR